MLTQKNRFLLSLMLMLPVAVLAQLPQYPPVAQVAHDFRAMLNRPVVDFKANFANVRMDTIEVDKGTICTEETEKMPVLIYKPVIPGQTSFPVVIFLHGTGGTKDAADLKAMLAKLAKLGIMGVAIDARYHGERIQGGPTALRNILTQLTRHLKPMIKPAMLTRFYMIPLMTYGAWLII